MPIIIKNLEVGYVPTSYANESPLRKRILLVNELKDINPVFTLEGKEFNLILTKGGGLIIDVNGERYLVESNFSYPFMKKEEWNYLKVANSPIKKGEWSLTKCEKGRKGELLIECEGKFYNLKREIIIKGEKIEIKDTLKNKSNEDIGIVFDNKIIPNFMIENIYRGGKYRKTYYPYSGGHVSNTTIYFIGKQSSLGIVALDDYYRLQLEMKVEGQIGYFHNRNFALPAGDSYTFVWAIYPLTTKDYYTFINKVRKDYIPNYTIEGPASFFNYARCREENREEIKKYIENTGTKIFILSGPYGGAPWLGGYPWHIYKIPGEYNIDRHIKELKEASLFLKSIDPTIKCLVPFETPLTPDSPPGDLNPKFPDSVRILSNGQYALYPYGENPPEDPEGVEKFLKEKPHCFIYYPTLTNSYYKFMKEIIGKALKEGELDGIYFDLFGYCAQATYDKWDTRTADIDLETYTIKKKKALLRKITEDAARDIVKFILNYKKGDVVIANEPAIITEKLKDLPVYYFSENIEDYAYTSIHLDPTPISLGWTPGYKEGAEYISKEGDWWKTWKTSKDFFEDIKDKIKHGNLYYIYVAPPGDYWKAGQTLEYPTILSRMYPITIEEIGEGWIKGKERIITLNSGEYTFGDKSLVDVYFYDKNGKETTEGKVEVIKRERENLFKIEIPEGGAAVIVKKGNS